MTSTYIIEHLEPELFPWCIIEYKHISKNVGKNNLWFTNIKKKDVKKLEEYGSVFQQSVKEMNLQNTCILDPVAEKELTPKEAKSFDFFIFGGILGDDPPRKRTEPELSVFLPKAEKRHIGKGQLSTDNAVYVVQEIASGIPLNGIPLTNNSKIKINKIESIDLPYTYPLVKGKPRMSPELVKYLKMKKGF